MKILICGAGRVATELLKRLGEGWDLTLVEKSRERIEAIQRLLPHIENVCADDACAEDASSPVVLDKAGIEKQDYVLALTGSDAVNKAIADYAGKKGVTQVIALANDPAKASTLEETGAQVVNEPRLVADQVYHYLQDPLVHVTPLLTGPGSCFEFKVGANHPLLGRKTSALARRRLRLGLVFRNKDILFPTSETVIMEGDRLVVMGPPDAFDRLKGLLAAGAPHFPHNHGQGVFVALVPGAADTYGPLIEEANYFSRNAKIRQVTVMCPEEECNIDRHLEQWSRHDRQVVATSSDNFVDNIHDQAGARNFGLICLPPFEGPFFASLTKTTLVRLAHDLAKPVLVTRSSMPYDKILVPFTATRAGEQAVEAAVDLAEHFSAEITVAVVEEPEFIRGEEEKKRVERVLSRLSELAHIHKVTFNRVVREGNPVKEIVDLAQDFDLLVLGSTNKEKGWFAANVGEHLAQKAPCSVLIITA
jgi:Trk K+ transport system NAD-binding subunit/nucleotide-binding universal stress UspA family protein